MKWSELPKEYQDLIDGLSDDLKEIIDYDPKLDDISCKFKWTTSEMICKLNLLFWSKCYRAKTINELPKIPK